MSRAIKHNQAWLEPSVFSTSQSHKIHRNLKIERNKKLLNHIYKLHCLICTNNRKTTTTKHLHTYYLFTHLLSFYTLFIYLHTFYLFTHFLSIYTLFNYLHTFYLFTHFLSIYTLVQNQNTCFKLVIVSLVSCLRPAISRLLRDVKPIHCFMSDHSFPWSSCHPL